MDAGEPADIEDFEGCFQDPWRAGEPAAIWMPLRRPGQTPKQCAWTQQQTRKKMAANKKYYEAKHRQSAPPIGPGSKIIVRNSQSTTRMHGRLGYRYSGPFVVLSICKKSGVITYGNDGKKLKCSRINAKLYAERQKYTATADAQKTTGKWSTAPKE